MTEKQRQIVLGLESLLHYRFSEADLNKKLSELFGEEIVARKVDDPEWTGDWYFTFESEQEGISGWFDIYYLEMRKHDDDDLHFYVTEVAFGFD